MENRNTRRGCTQVNGVGQALPDVTNCQVKPDLHKQQSGFTLIELLVVVLIIGILAAVAVPQYQKAVIKSRIVQQLTVFNAYSKAIDLWLLQNGWPTETVIFTGHGKNQAGLDFSLSHIKEGGEGRSNVDISSENGLWVEAQALSGGASVQPIYPCEYAECGEKACVAGFARFPSSPEWAMFKISVFKGPNSGYSMVKATENQCPKFTQMMCQYWATQGTGLGRNSSIEQCARFGITLTKIE